MLGEPNRQPGETQADVRQLFRTVAASSAETDRIRITKTDNVFRGRLSQVAYRAPDRFNRNPNNIYPRHIVIGTFSYAALDHRN